jgi:phage tail-like protein
MAVDNQKFFDKPVYSGAHFSIEIDGISKGSNDLPTLRSVDGGGVQADVLSYQMGDKGDVWRQLGKPKYSDIKLTLGLADVEGFRNWVNQYLTGQHVRKSGAIIAADYNYMEKARREIKEAMIVGLGLPKWDANDKNQANITITLAPEQVIYKASEGKQIQAQNPSEEKQKKIPACNFTFSLDGLSPDVFARTVKVEAMEIKCKTIEHHYGTRLEPIKVPGKMEWPNLVFYVPEVDSEPLRMLHNDRMAGIRADQGKGTTGTLVFKNNAQMPMGEFHFMGVHIFNVQTEKSDASTEELKLVKVECAIEGIGLVMRGEQAWVTGK